MRAPTCSEYDTIYYISTMIIVNISIGKISQCLAQKQPKRPSFLHTRATCSELPSHISTMVLQGVCRNTNIINLNKMDFLFLLLDFSLFSERGLAIDTDIDIDKDRNSDTGVVKEHKHIKYQL